MARKSGRKSSAELMGMHGGMTIRPKVNGFKVPINVPTIGSTVPGIDVYRACMEDGIKTGTDGMAKMTGPRVVVTDADGRAIFDAPSSLKRLPEQIAQYIAADLDLPMELTDEVDRVIKGLPAPTPLTIAPPAVA